MVSLLRGDVSRQMLWFCLGMKGWQYPNASNDLNEALALLIGMERLDQLSDSLLHVDQEQHEQVCPVKAHFNGWQPQ